MKFHVLVGIGANSVEVPCLIFSSRKAGIKAVSEILGEPQIAKDGTPWWDTDKKWDGKHGSNEGCDEGCKYCESTLPHFFTHYYDGCGGCYSLELREVEEGKPFVGFDLD